jgi:hypothetical protein
MVCRYSLSREHPSRWVLASILIDIDLNSDYTDTLLGRGRQRGMPPSGSWFPGEVLPSASWLGTRQPVKSVIYVFMHVEFGQTPVFLILKLSWIFGGGGVSAVMYLHRIYN